MNKDIEKALSIIRSNAARYARSERYYNGEHDLAFATEKFQNTFGTLFREFALNLCPVVCDAVRDKLRVTGFSLEAGTPETDARNRTIWQRNRMARRSGEIHKEALRSGDAYAIVWPDASGKATIFPNRAAGFAVMYDEDSPGRLLWAAKTWVSADQMTRLNLFYADRVERYVSRYKTDQNVANLAEFVPAKDAEPETVPNPYGQVPVFHFANNADVGSLGRSEIDPAIPVQDGLNKSVLDMLVAMEYSAYRQRWAAGIEFAIDESGNAVAPFKSGVDRVWMAENPNARFGDFEAAHLEQFLKVKDSFRVDVASVTGTPLHYFLPVTSGLPSGESLKKAETRFLAKVRDRQESFGQMWSDAMQFALTIEGTRGVRLLTEWEDPAPMSEKELLENILLKKQIGLGPEQALIEAGYGAADVRRMVTGPAFEDGTNQ